MQGNLHFKIDWASLILESKFIVFALFYFVFDCNFPSTSPWGAYIILEGQFNGGLFASLVWGAYIWRGLFSEFYSILMFNIGSYCHNYVCLMIIHISSSYGCDLRYLTARVAHPSLCIRKQKKHCTCPSSPPTC